MKKNGLKTIVLSALITTTLGGCQSTTGQQDIATMSVNQQYKRTLPKAAVFPNKEQINGKTPRVVLLASETDIKLAKKAQLGSTVFSALENILQKAGLDLVSRTIGSKVKNELITYEASGQYQSSGLDVADVAILPTITKAIFSRDFSKARTWEDKKGKSHTIEASCRYIAEVSGFYKTYTLPKLSLKHNIKMAAQASFSRDNSSSYCPLSDVQMHGLVSQAAENAVRSSRARIQNAFAPKAYVMEYRAMNKNHIILISMGKNRQLKRGQSIRFIRQVKNVNDLTGESRIDELVIGEGNVTSSIQSDVAWVDTDEKTARKLKLGDIASIVFERSWLETAKDAFE